MTSLGATLRRLRRTRRRLRHTPRWTPQREGQYQRARTQRLARVRRGLRRGELLIALGA